MAGDVTRVARERIDLRGEGSIRLAADVAGDPDGAPVLLFHGGGQTRHAWGTTLDALARRGWRAYTVDLRGHGESEWSPDGEYGLTVFADDVYAITRTFAIPPVLVGASLGGLSSMIAIGTRPAETVASALVLVDVAPRMEEAGRDRIGEFMREHVHDGFATLDDVADAVQRYNPHRPRPTDLNGLKKNLRQREDGRWYWHWDPAFMRGPKAVDETRASFLSPETMEQAARSLNLPTLLVRGRVSDLLSEEGARHFLSLAPHAELADVAGAGHMVAGDRNDLFNDAVVGFLDRAVRR